MQHNKLISDHNISNLAEVKNERNHERHQSRPRKTEHLPNTPA